MEKKQVAAALAERLANHRVPDRVVDSLAAEISVARHAPIGVDVCMYGICLDYFVDRPKLKDLLEELRIDHSLGGVRIFPKGIINPDKFLVQVERAVDRG